MRESVSYQQAGKSGVVLLSKIGLYSWTAKEAKTHGPGASNGLAQGARTEIHQPL
jgi:hypothetical protein